MQDPTEAGAAAAVAPDAGTDPDTAVRAAAARLQSARTRGELGIIVAREISAYSLPDLQIIGGRLHSEIELLPSPYREAIRPFFREQIFGKHHHLLSMYRCGVFDRDAAPIRDPETFRDFCTMLQEGCFVPADAHERNPDFQSPKNRLFYYLIAAFTMYVLDEPGHPVGMPFPGGFTVEQRGSDYYCLIRDREKEVVHSICNFCPARQLEEEKKE